MFEIPRPEEIQAELKEELLDCRQDYGADPGLALCRKVQAMLARITGSFVVRLTRSLPVESRHGMVEGRHFWAWDERELTGKEAVWVKGDDGENVRLLRGEFEELK